MVGSMMQTPNKLMPQKMGKAAPNTGLLYRGNGPKNENIRVYLRMRPFNQKECDRSEHMNNQQWTYLNDRTAISL